MPRLLPRTLRLPLCAVTTRSGLARHVASTLHPRTSDLDRTIHCYAFKNDERAFAAALLARRTQLWLFRTHQAAACGDFVVVDLSSPDPARRTVVFLELKSGAPVRVGGGSAGWQLRHTDLGLAELVSRGLVATGTPYEVLAGDGTALLGALGVAA